MSYVNLPGAFADFIDGNLVVTAPETDPRVLYLGTASSGVNYGLWRVGRTNDARQEFGISGTLVRGMYEGTAQGAKNVYLMRVGGTPAILTGIGCTAGDGGWTVTTSSSLDDEAGANFFIYYNDSEDLLEVYNSSGDIVYSNDPADPIDLGVVSVTGSRCLAGGADIGTVSAYVAMEDVTAIGTVYTAGSDQLNPSRMEFYESLHDAYEYLDFQSFDVVCPVNAYIDELNSVDETVPAWTAGNTYPTAGALTDKLGQVFVQRYNGTNYFWWDLTGNGVADIFPTGPAAASATTDAKGDTINAFNEANFGYQLANFCYNATENYQACVGTVGVRPPNSLGLSDVATWVGELPTYTVNNSTGASSITGAGNDGTGLLGNKFMAGSATFRGGEAYGGFIATGTDYVDGTELSDENDQPVDIGKYLSVVGAWVVHTNPTDTTRRGYLGNFAASYAGFITRLSSESAPTNKTVRRVGLPYRIPASTLDDLAGARYIMLVNKSKGTVVADAPTAARPGTDWTRLTTMRITAETVQRLRIAADPFMGEPISTPQISALNTAIEQTLNSLKSEGKLQDFRFRLIITPQDAIVGTANLDLVLVPAFELRRIFISTSLAGELV